MANQKETSKKQTKTEQLTVALEIARAEHARLTAELEPVIEREEKRVMALRAEQERADKAYRALDGMKVQAETMKRLGLAGDDLKSLKTKISALLIAQDLPQADVVVVIAHHTKQVLANDAEWQAFSTKRDLLARASEKASRAWNIATNVGNLLAKSRCRLIDSRDQVTKLENELEQLPLRNERQRDTRREERERAESERQTQEALKLFDGGLSL